jgi:transcriptional regulator with XRE-family HTH domain
MDPQAVGRVRAALGQRISRARRATGWTQAVLAEAVDIESCTLSRYECGLREPPLHVLLDIARVLRIPLVSLLGLTDEASPPEGSHEEPVPDDDELLAVWGRLDGRHRRLVLSMARALAT